MHLKNIFFRYLIIRFKNSGPSGKEPTIQCRRPKHCRISPWVGKILWRRKWNPLQYSCLENPMDRGAWQTTVDGVAKSQTRLKQLRMHNDRSF